MAGGQISAETLGKILSTKDDQKENTRLAKGLVELKSVMMGGVVDLVTGKIKSMVIPVLTKAHILVNQGTTLDERVDNIKRMCDTNNKIRPGREVLASAAARDMENHDLQLIRQLPLGNFSTVPLVTLTEKRVKLSLVHWLPMGKESSDHTQQ